MQDISKLDPFFVGFERFWKQFDEIVEQVDNNTAYPPYNIIKGDGCYYIQVALAGFEESEIEVTASNNKVTIKGEPHKTDDEFQIKGISQRPFTREFAVADNLKVGDASFIDGLLEVELDVIIREEDKPEKIAINATRNLTDKKEFLTED